MPMDNTIWTTFSPEDNVLVLWETTSPNGTMMMESVVEAWSVTYLGFFFAIVAMKSRTMTQRKILPKLVKISLVDCVDDISRCGAHFHILKGHHLKAMSINVQIFVDLKFLCRSHTKIRKPHLLMKRLNFCMRKKVATFLHTTILCGHKMDISIFQYAILLMLLFSTRYATKIIYAQTLVRTHCGQQSIRRLFMPTIMIPHAYSFMENQLKGPLMQGKSPR